MFGNIIKSSLFNHLSRGNPIQTRPQPQVGHTLPTFNHPHLFGDFLRIHQHLWSTSITSVVTKVTNKEFTQTNGMNPNTTSSDLLQNAQAKSWQIFEQFRHCSASKNEGAFFNTDFLLRQDIISPRRDQSGKKGTQPCAVPLVKSHVLVE